MHFIWPCSRLVRLLMPPIEAICWEFLGREAALLFHHRIRGIVPRTQIDFVHSITVYVCVKEKGSCSPTCSARLHSPSRDCVFSIENFLCFVSEYFVWPIQQGHHQERHGFLLTAWTWSRSNVFESLSLPCLPETM